MNEKDRLYREMKQKANKHNKAKRCTETVREQLFKWCVSYTLGMCLMLVLGGYTSLGELMLAIGNGYIIIPIVLYFTIKQVYPKAHEDGATWGVCQFAVDTADAEGYAPPDELEDEEDEWVLDEEFRCIHCQQRLGGTGFKACPNCGNDPYVLGTVKGYITDARADKQGV